MLNPKYPMYLLPELILLKIQLMKSVKSLLHWALQKLLAVWLSLAFGILMHYLLHRIILQENCKTRFILMDYLQKKLELRNKLEKFLNLTKKIGDIIGILTRQEKWFFEHIQHV